MTLATRLQKSKGLDANNRRHFLRLIGVAATVSFGSMHAAHSQTLPDTIRVVTPFPAGSPVEASLRALSQALKLTSGRTYIVDNKPGAGGVIATNEVAKAKSDGSVLLHVTSGHASSAALYSNLPFDPVNDFTAITRLLTAPGFGLLVSADSPYRTVHDLIKAGKAKPGTIAYASLGNGNPTHLTAALFSRAAGVDFIHVPYRTSPMPDILGGRVDFTFLGTTISRPLVASGKIRMLATSSSTRLPEAPDVPTFAELGFKDAEVPAWVGILAPKGLPMDVANQIHQEIVEATKHPSFVAYVKSAGNDVINTPPAQFAAYLKSEVATFQRTLPPLGIKMD
jgi:tripartite-type tricarboxylate transporter receptor subunit TctC